MTSAGRAGLAAVVLGPRIVVLGGHDGNQTVKTVEVFVPENPDPGRQWTPTFQEISPMHARRAYLSAVALDGKVVAVGGSADGRVLNTMEMLDIEADNATRWFELPAMQTKRTLHGTTSVDGKLFSCGGFDGIRDLDLTEMYDPKHKAWHRLMNMDMGRSYLAVVSVGSFIYALGGQQRIRETGPRAYSTVEVFDLYSERWSPGVDLLSARLGHAAAVLEDDGEEYIYVCGGSDGSDVLASVERFSVARQSWEEVASMHTARLGHAVAVVDGKLYVIGGYDGQETLDTYECYDPEERAWALPLPMHEEVGKNKIAFGRSRTQAMADAAPAEDDPSLEERPSMSARKTISAGSAPRSSSRSSPRTITPAD